MEGKPGSFEVAHEALNIIREHAQIAKSAAHLEHIQDVEARLRNLISTGEVSDPKGTMRLFRDCNELAPINRLPPELAFLIFLSYINPDLKEDWWNVDARRRTLIQVCSSWFHIVINTPEFWTVLTSEQKPDERKTILSRAQSLPLQMTCRSCSTEPEFLSAAAREIHQWEVVELWDLAPGIDLAFLEQASVPFLRSISLSADTSDAGPRVLDLLGGVAPRLKDIHLSGITLCNWASGMLQDLHLLQLTFDSSDFNPSVQQILDVLRSSPNLRSLALNGDCVKPMPLTSGDPNFAPTNLQRLERIALALLPGTVVETITAHIEAPHCRDYLFNLADSTPTIQATIVSQILPSLLNHYQPAYFARISIESMSFSLSIFRDDSDDDAYQGERPTWFWELCNGGDGDDSTSTGLRRTVRELAKVSKLPITRLRISVWYPTPGLSAEICRWLDHFEDLHQLVLENWFDGDVDEIILSLCKPEIEGWAGRWKCPRLEKVCIIGCDEWSAEKLLEMVKQRTGLSSTHDPPANIRDLVVEEFPHTPPCLDNATFEALRDIIGDGMLWLQAEPSEPSIEGESLMAEE